MSLPVDRVPHLTLHEWLSHGPEEEIQDKIRRFYAVYPEIDAENIYLEAQTFSTPPSSEVAARLLAGTTGSPERAIVTHRGQTVKVALPIFQFSAPDVPGCAISVESRKKRFRSVGWRIAFNSVKGGASASCEVAMKSTFTAEAGQRKMVFVQVPAVEVCRLHLSDNPSIERQNDYEYEITGPPKGLDQLASMTLGKSQDGQMGKALAAYALRHDVGVSEYEYTYTQGIQTNLELGLSSKQASSSLEVTAKLEGSLTFRYSLSGGYNYTLHQTADGKGIAWRASRN
jgi:hypothetical protein